MAVRSLQFFMTPTEFETLLVGVMKGLKLTAYLEKFSPPKVELMEDMKNIKMRDGTWPDRVLLTEEKLSPQGGIDKLIKEAKRGWVSVDVPREEGDRLFMGGIGTKAESLLALELFKKVKPYFVKILKHPVWAWNVNISKSATAYRNIGYSSGAQEAECRGVKLRQDGVANVRFSTVPPSTVS